MGCARTSRIIGAISSNSMAKLCLMLRVIRPTLLPMATLRFAIVGCGWITLQNHVPGLALCPDVQLVALCDADQACLERARQQTGVRVTSTSYVDVVCRDDVDAVIIA